MIWLAWRQFRTHAWIAVAGLAGLGTLLVATFPSISDATATAGLDACANDCTKAIGDFLRIVRSALPGAIFNVTTALGYAVPLLMGVFWGAPLVAREFEAGTHNLAWNQSVSRLRWLAVKLAVLATATVATAGVMSVGIAVWGHDIDAAAGNRITPVVFGVRGTVPIGYALFALTLGVAAGLVLRRAVRAMAVTLVVSTVLVGFVPVLVRPHLVPPEEVTRPLETTALRVLALHGDGSIEVAGLDPENAWVIANETITPTGELFAGPVDPTYCGRDVGPSLCQEWLATLGLQQNLTYHPDSHFWPLQLIESGVFLAAAAVLAAFALVWIRLRPG